MEEKFAIVWDENAKQVVAVCADSDEAEASCLRLASNRLNGENELFVGSVELKPNKFQRSVLDEQDKQAKADLKEGAKN